MGKFNKTSAINNKHKKAPKIEIGSLVKGKESAKNTNMRNLSIQDTEPKVLAIVKKAAARYAKFNKTKGNTDD